MMRERGRVRGRDYYEDILKYHADDRERSFTGDVVIHGKEQPWVMGRQAKVRYYLVPSRYHEGPQEAAVDDWTIFIQDVGAHSGMHRHQGGLVIYILEGEGYSVVDGVRHDWEAGDLLLLPIKPGGVEHQHFNKYDDKPAKWIAFINVQVFEWGASDMVQIKDHPEWAKTRR